MNSKPTAAPRLADEVRHTELSVKRGGAGHQTLYESQVRVERHSPLRGAANLFARDLSTERDRTACQPASRPRHAGEPRAR